MSQREVIKVHKRLKELRLMKGMSQSQMAERINLSRNHISSLESGKRNITERTIDDICREFNVNREWLVEGKGECFKNTLSSYPDLDDATRTLMEKFMKLDCSEQEYVIALVDKLQK